MTPRDTPGEIPGSTPGGTPGGILRPRDIPRPKDALSDNDLWLLSYYRSSEINGALFFGRVARTLRPGRLQAEVTHHFADEADHARYWTDCVNDLGHAPAKLREAYQDQYLQAVGVPSNLMEVMAITQVFERRVIGQYRQHLRAPGLHPRIRQTLERIMEDERWHIQYVRDALKDMERRYGADHIAATLERFSRADDEIHAKTLAEYGDRIGFLAQVSAERIGVEYVDPRIEPVSAPAPAPAPAPRGDGPEDFRTARRRNAPGPGAG